MSFIEWAKCSGVVRLFHSFIWLVWARYTGGKRFIQEFILPHIISLIYHSLINLAFILSHKYNDLANVYTAVNIRWYKKDVFIIISKFLGKCIGTYSFTDG